MGITFANLKIRKSRYSKVSKEITFMVASGACYSFVPKDVLEELKIKPHDTRNFILANGESIKRKLGEAYFEYNNCKGIAGVIFAEPGDEPLLGATTLEAMGLGLNPIQREIVPITKFYA